MIDTAPERPPTESIPTKRISLWLRDFERGLSRLDVAAATRLFVDKCYWRDLVAFTWNIATLEGRDGIEKMLEANLASVKPSNFVIEAKRMPRMA